MEGEKRSSNHSLYQYTIEMNEELDTSLKNMTSDQVEKMVAQENMKNLALSLKNKSEYGHTGFRYVLEAQTECEENLAKLTENCDNDVEDGNKDFEDDDKQVGGRLVIDLSMGPSKCKTNESYTPLTGATKRKRKSHRDNVHINNMKTKTQTTDSVNSETSEPTDLGLRVNKSKISEDISDCWQPTKVVITDNYDSGSQNFAKSSSPVSATEMLKRAASNYEHKTLKSSGGKFDSSEMPSAFSGTSPILFASTPSKSNLTATSTPIKENTKKNRRKKYVPIKLEQSEIVEAKTVNSEEHAKCSNNVSDLETGPMDLSMTGKKKPEPRSPSLDVEGPLDLSARSSPIESVKKLPQKAFNNFEPVNLSKSEPAPVNLIKTEQVENGFRAAMDSKTLPLNLAIPSHPSLPAFYPNGFPSHPMMAGANPQQVKDFFELMMKMQSQFPNQNLLQANTQVMQFQAMMQSAMLNNSMLAMKGLSNYHHSTPVKNDKNANIIKAETPERKYEVSSPTHSTNGFFNSNMDYFSKNLISSSPFLAGYNGFPGSVPFVPNLLEQKPGPGRRKRVKENSGSQGQVIERTSIPKIEDIPALKNITDSSSPEDIVETLKALFPVQPPKADAVHTYGTEENPVRFFVKDNEQIQTIVDSLLVICEIKPFEDHLPLGGEQNYKNVCRLCNSVFFHIEHLTKHVKKVHIVKRFQCDQCDRSFHDAGNYRQHMRVHDDSDIPFECEECYRRFRHKCTLKVHMRIHTGEKPFKCEICSATFKISSGLQTHMRKHTGETPYACEFCSMRFKCQSNLKQHLFQHTQSRPFPCEVCGKSYSRKSIRDAHVLTHTVKDGLNGTPYNHPDDHSPPSSQDTSLDSLDNGYMDESEFSNHSGLGSEKLSTPELSVMHTGQAVFAGH